MNLRPTLISLLALGAPLGAARAQTPPAAPPAQTAPAPAVPAAPQTRPIPAANYVATGVFYYEQGKYDEAYVAFRAASELDPRNVNALLGLGRTQVKLRLYSAATETLKRLIAIDSRNISAYIALSQAYQQQYIGAGDRASVTGNLNEALRVLADAETLAQAQSGTDRNVSLSKVWNERGYVYKLQGDGPQAIDAFKQASSLNPDNSIFLYNLGDMYYATGNLPLALDYLQQAVIADPRDSFNRAYYAKLLALSGNVSAARPEAAQAAKLAPNNAYAVGQYGVVSYLAKDTVTAAAQLNAAVKLDPLRYPEFYYYLGRLNLDAGDLKSARENLTRAAALGSSTPEYAYYLGLSYERGAGQVAPDRVKARENYQRALKLNPNYKPAQDGLARVGTS
ncbi:MULTISPECIES: tetratricopeptide repeat protein [Deinococcus]|uniref:Tetratricopeptide repeat protein n=1 Tax=Deinococcus rufus TaxID=2136097 RepID=A0ABV7Z672_9DEIO|nr:tetratricopeptide repeat protein [Deinococcus sp. AB2017081]WQE96347.1 tetratricopeptide repeat protein [Deinococcus sp. AB2017081]